MPDSTLLLFLATSLLIIVSPGQDMVLVISRSIAQGRQAGVITAAGVSVGLLGHTVLAALGLGAVLQASELVFKIMKYLGAAYLVYLGIKAFKAPAVEFGRPGRPSGSLRVLFYQGAISNLSNPKIAVFYFAFLPQFVTSGNSYPTQTLLALGAAFALITFTIKAPIGYSAGALSGWFRSRPRVQVWLNRISGTVLVGLGLRLAVQSQPGN
ncbi:MAG: LysE family translocator [Gammaproteobacteria bacterium]|nr:LysE family translocator [Gammaproteobacteria bacterium]